ncbi:MAG: hypothetical protein PHE67_04135 [Campylobacterales bacterium]|nr:hypothetical protein [Campylobacterales bacterium]
MFKTILSLIVGASIAFASTSQKVNIDHLVLTIEEIAKDIKRLESRMDKISNQAYEAKVSTVEHEEYLRVLGSKLEELSSLSLSLTDVKTDLAYSAAQAPSLEQDSQGKYYYVAAKTGLRVRKSATMDPAGENIIDILKHNTPVYALCTQKEPWCYLPDRKGFVNKQYLIRRGEK